MKTALNLLFLIFTFLTFVEESLSLTDYQIRKICKKEKLEFTCIKNFQKKRYNLQKGDLIEIPVIPNKRDL